MDSAELLPYPERLEFEGLVHTPLPCTGRTRCKLSIGHVHALSSVTGSSDLRSPLGLHGMQASNCPHALILESTATKGTVKHVNISPGVRRDTR